jgi:hypothetical protein
LRPVPWSTGDRVNRLRPTATRPRGGLMEELDQEQSGPEQLDEVEEEAADLDAEELEDVDLEDEDGGDDI